ncbi:hypothetical protein TrRE_jg7936, partial [Triparma retinervis]
IEGEDGDEDSEDEKEKEELQEEDGFDADADFDDSTSELFKIEEIRGVRMKDYAGNRTDTLKVEVKWVGNESPTLEPIEEVVESAPDLVMRAVLEKYEEPTTKVMKEMTKMTIKERGEINTWLEWARWRNEGGGDEDEDEDEEVEEEEEEKDSNDNEEEEEEEEEEEDYSGEQRPKRKRTNAASAKECEDALERLTFTPAVQTRTKRKR